MSDDSPTMEIKFGGWHNGDNWKPGRGWFYVCRCGRVGLGQLLPMDAARRWRDHARSCAAITAEELA